MRSNPHEELGTKCKALGSAAFLRFSEPQLENNGKLVARLQQSEFADPVI
jgi:hypothetical protein